MRAKQLGVIPSVVVLLMVAAPAGCNSIIGLDKYTMSETAPDSGSGGEPAKPEAAITYTNEQCTRIATEEAIAAGQIADAGDTGGIPAMWRNTPTGGKCVKLLNNYCPVVTGDYKDPDAVLIGSLFAVTGPTKDQNIDRELSARLAVGEINDQAGGIPGPSAEKRSLVMVSCDAELGVVEAAKHLAIELGVPAIVGPNTSQHTIDVSNKVTIAANTLVLSPTAIASSIADIDDNGLTWLMVASEAQRAALLIQQLRDLEQSLRTARGIVQPKISIVYRADALGKGTYESLKDIPWGGMPLMQSQYALAAAYETADKPQESAKDAQIRYADQQIQFAPDIVILGGLAEAVDNILMTMERKWTAGPNRPYYIGIDPLKGPNIRNAALTSDDLRHRIRGIGVTQVDSLGAYNSFIQAFKTKYSHTPGPAGCGPSYDAVYAIAYALAATRNDVESGPNVAKGLAMLSDGWANGGAAIQTGVQQLNAAYSAIRESRLIAATGTFGAMRWDSKGNAVAGTAEMWCVGIPEGGQGDFQTSGLYLDIASQTAKGQYTQCAP